MNEEIQDCGWGAGLGKKKNGRKKDLEKRNENQFYIDLKLE